MADNERTVVKGLSGGGVTEDSNCVQVDVKDGKIIRIRPFHFDWKYERKPWQMKARGQIFEASMKTLIPPFTLAYKTPPKTFLLPALGPRSNRATFIPALART